MNNTRRPAQRDAACRTVLIVEDDASIVQSLTLYLRNHDFEVVSCSDGLLAFSTFRASSPDLVILDLNLPGKDGLAVCAEIREYDNTPIIVLSARNVENDKIYALENGADDYIDKPFSPRELVARILAVLKRVAPPEIPRNELFVYGDLSLDTDNFMLVRKEEEIKVTKTEFQLLLYLLERRGRVVLREDLMRDIMGYDNYLYDRTIDTHVKNLRKKLGDSCSIETVRGMGYRVSDPVS